MISELEFYLIKTSESIYQALGKLNHLRRDLNLFVVDENRILLGSVTDGDIRRGILKGITLDDSVSKVMNTQCKFLKRDSIDLNVVKEQRARDIKILPVLNDKREVVDLLNFNKIRTILPVDAVIMAGGQGTRLLPLTKNTPKPLLEVGGKPILAYNLERLQKFGVVNISITVNYLKEQIMAFVKNNSREGNNLTCIVEKEALGTIGALSLIEQWHNDYVLLTNSDLLTNIDYENFFLEFIASRADMMVAAIQYPLKVPYAILEIEGDNITAFKEKPEYTHYANTGIYLFKRSLLKYIPRNSFFNATDLMDKVIEEKLKLSYYPLFNYWLDIGNHEDFRKAQDDIRHLTMN